jgi:peptide/nickel transport system ATP-binding protein
VSAPLLEVEDLGVRFATAEGELRAVEGLSFRLERGEVLGLVGESGCGKSAAALALLDLVAPPGRRSGGRIRLAGADLVAGGPRAFRAARGRRMAMVFQDPMTSLNPYLRVEEQLAEAALLRGGSRREARRRAAALLERVGIAEVARCLRGWPHQLSGGQRQRVMIAMALLGEPELLVADEPTTALDVTTQAQLLALLRELQRERGLAVLFITHDLAVAAGLCDRVAVMYAGRLVEEAPAADLFARPTHPYTAALLACAPRLDGPRGGRLTRIEGLPPRLREAPGSCTFAPRCPRVRAACWEREPALEASGGRLRRCVVPASEFGAAGPAGEGDGLASASPSAPSRAPALLSVRAVRAAYGAVQALDGVSFELAPGEILALVGESGSGKSTLARVLVGLLPAQAGEARFDGADLLALDGRSWRPFRRRLQLVFQDPGASLDPRMRVAALVAEPLAIHERLPRRRREARVAALLDQVGLAPELAGRWPHQLSGGERQRVGLARALALEPELLLLDEPVSSLDVSVQAQILNLLAALRARRGLAFLLIAHHLGVVRQLADRVAVLFAGRVVEEAPAERLFAEPLHPYTRALLAASPRPEPGRLPEALGAPAGEPVPGAGCAYRTRCPLAVARCAAEAPAPLAHRPGRLVACHRAGEPFRAAQQQGPGRR